MVDVSEILDTAILFSFFVNSFWNHLFQIDSFDGVLELISSWR